MKRNEKRILNKEDLLKEIDCIGNKKCFTKKDLETIEELDDLISMADPCFGCGGLDNRSLCTSNCNHYIGRN